MLSKELSEHVPVQSPWKSLFVLIICQTLWVFCYPPFDLGPFLFFLWVPMFWATDRLSRRQAFWYHFIAGLFYNALMYYWLYNAMKVGSPWIILSGLGLLVVVFSAVNGYLGALYLATKHSKWHKILYPTLWVGVEVARTKGQMSFPWGHLGYGLGDVLPWVQSTAWIGVFGLSWIIMWTNGVVYAYFQQRRWSSLAALATGKWMPAVRSSLSFLKVLWLPIGLFLFGTIVLWRAPTEAEQRPRISLVQPSVDQAQKWDEEYFEGVVHNTLALMDSSDIGSSDLVILPETAIPDFLKDRPNVQRKFLDKAYQYSTNIVLGSLDYERFSHPGRPYTFYNSAYLFSENPRQNIRQYSKQYLVPFSERLPFDNIFPVINYVNLGEGDFAPGEGNVVWGEKYKYSPSICYEVVYPQFVRKVRDLGVDLLVNITNDGWFGKSAAPYQHANITRFRAVESGISIARCANTGISIFYDVYGRDLGHTGLMEEVVLSREVPLYSRNTLYQWWGDAVEWFFFWFWFLYTVRQLISYFMRVHQESKLRLNSN